MRKPSDQLQSDRQTAIEIPMGTLSVVVVGEERADTSPQSIGRGEVRVDIGGSQPACYPPIAL